MDDWVYTIRGRFFPASSEYGREYLAVTGLSNFAELVTLDAHMCPDIVTDLHYEDWSHNVHEAYGIMFFRDPDYLMSRQPLDLSRHQLLAVFERPSGSESVPPGFTRCGFDIMDSSFCYSTLTNCGPIPEAFTPSMLNEFGLISDCKTALDVRDRMRQLKPDDYHLGNCEAWFIARILPSG